MKHQFSLQTITTSGAGMLRSIKPDKDGVYKGVPLTIIGKPSRNNVLYDEDSFIAAMTRPETVFYKAITGGGLDGEWGHPFLDDLPNEQSMLKRLQLIVEERVSHFFKRIYSEATSDGKYIMVRGDVKPYGEKRDRVIEGFEDPDHDLGFSLRALCTKPVMTPQRHYLKKIVSLVTYDAVSLPGYEEASKRGMVGTESLQLGEVDIQDEILADNLSLESLEQDKEFLDTVGYESIRCQELLDLFQTDEIKVSYQDKPLGSFDMNAKNFRTSNIQSRSPFHTLFGRR